MMPPMNSPCPAFGRPYTCQGVASPVSIISM
jgi:hypothetical protein